MKLLAKSCEIGSGASCDDLNSPNPLSANPTVAEITAKCTEIISKEYGSTPQLAVNMCAGTALQGLNK